MRTNRQNSYSIWFHTANYFDLPASIKHHILADTPEEAVSKIPPQDQVIVLIDTYTGELFTFDENEQRKIHSA